MVLRLRRHSPNHSALLGIVSATFVIAALVGSFAVSVRAASARIAVRGAGSWVAAIGLLSLGWNLRGTF